MQDEKKKDAADLARDAFHAHLDACKQCREHPMALCFRGIGLMIDFQKTQPSNLVRRP